MSDLEKDGNADAATKGDGAKAAGTEKISPKPAKKPAKASAGCRETTFKERIRRQWTHRDYKRWCRANPRR